MTNDPELKAMSEVFDALQGLDRGTQKRVVEWVMTKLGDSTGSTGAKRGRKPGAKAASKTGAKRGRKPGRPAGKTGNVNPQAIERHGGWHAQDYTKLAATRVV